MFAYFIKNVTKSQRNHFTTEREHSVVDFTNHFKSYLLWRKFMIATGHRALVWLYCFKDPERMIAA